MTTAETVLRLHALSLGKLLQTKQLRLEGTRIGLCLLSSLVKPLGRRWPQVVVASSLCSLFLLLQLPRRLRLRLSSRLRGLITPGFATS